jgi:two-component system, sensor histidine kinase
MQPEHPKRPVILLVDDEPASILEIGTALSQFALVRVALNGREALDIVQSGHERPDLILLDIIMPEMDGYETCRRIRNLDCAREIPIIFITSLAASGDQIKALEGGALDFITKPVQVPFLMHKIVNHLDLIRLRGQALEQARSELRAVEETRRALFDALPDVIMRFDLQGRYIFVSRNVERVVPFQAPQFMGKTVREFGFPEYSADQWAKSIAKVVESKMPLETEIFFRGRSGPVVHDWRLVPEFDEPGRVCSVLSISRDLTDKRRSEEQIRQNATINQAHADLIRALASGDSELADMAQAVHACAMRITGSEFGFTSSIDPETGSNVGHSLSSMMSGDQCRVEDRSISFPKGRGGYGGLWGVPLNSSAGFFTNDPSRHPAATGLPKGHVPITRFLAVPAIYQNRILGEIALANPGRDYTQEDLRAVTVLADLFALAIHRLRDTEDLQRAKEQAEEAGRVKNEFLTNMSHEIRTPLNGILGMLQLMQGSGLSDEQQEYAKLAVNSSTRLTNLLTDVLDLARIESGRVKVDCAPFSPRAVLESVQQLFLPAARHKGVPLLLEIDPDLPAQLAGDAAHLRQVLNNLVGNALKFTQTGSVILDALVLAHAVDGQRRVLFSVMDTGIGIPDDKLPRIFKPFAQVAEGFTRSYQGAGLGLSIVKHLVALMGGTISVCSEQNVGTSVCVSLPLGELPAAQSRQERIRAMAARNDLGFRVLLADDDPISLFATTRQLEMLGCQVTTAGNGQDVLDTLLEHDFDALFLDIQMPVMDGLQAARTIRTMEAFKKKASTPIVAITGHGQEEDIKKFRQAGIEMHITKPISLNAIAEAFLRCIAE